MLRPCSDLTSERTSQGLSMPVKYALESQVSCHLRFIRRGLPSVFCLCLQVQLIYGRWPSSTNCGTINPSHPLWLLWEMCSGWSSCSMDFRANIRRMHPRRTLCLCMICYDRDAIFVRIAKAIEQQQLLPGPLPSVHYTKRFVISFFGKSVEIS